MGWLDDLAYLVPGYGQVKLGGDIKQGIDERGGFGNLFFGENYGQRGGVGLNRGDTRLEHGGTNRQTLQGYRAGVEGRRAPQAGYTNIGSADPLTQQQNQWRSQQMGLAGDLRNVASGAVKGAGELATERQGAKALAQQLAQANMARGGNAALAARTAARATADISLDTKGQAAQAALSDQAAARAQLGQVVGQGRGQDIDVAGFQQQRDLLKAQLDQGTSLANVQARLQQTGMNDAQIIALMAQELGMDQAELQARLAQDNLRVQENLGIIGANKPGIAGDLLGALGQAGIKAAVASDVRLKENIRGGKPKVEVGEAVREVWGPAGYEPISNPPMPQYTMPLAPIPRLEGTQMYPIEMPVDDVSEGTNKNPRIRLMPVPDLPNSNRQPIEMPVEEVQPWWNTIPQQALRKYAPKRGGGGGYNY